MPPANSTTIIKQISLSTILARRADHQAAKLGLSTPEYIRYLITQDSRYQSATGERISEQTEKRYLRDLIEFLTSDEKNPRPSFTSAEALIQHLDQG